MTDITRILSGIEAGDPHAAEQLLPLLYEELRKLAAQKLAQEKPPVKRTPRRLAHAVSHRARGARTIQADCPDPDNTTHSNKSESRRKAPLIRILSSGGNRAPAVLPRPSPS
jgi:hypothetical protein